MFGRKNQLIYDSQNERPVIMSSICTGEKVIGFKNIHTGKFTDIELVHSEEDVRKFAKSYGIDETQITREY